MAPDRVPTFTGTDVLGHLAVAPQPSVFPIGDWQFWIATAVFVIAAVWLLRPILPIPFLKRRRGSGRRQKATLTIEGKVAPPTTKKL